MIFDKIIKNQEAVLGLIEESPHKRSNLCITYFNQHCFNNYKLDKIYRDLIENNFTVFLDGFGVYVALKFFGYKNIQKFNATDLYTKIFQQFSANQTKLFLIGGSFTDEFISLKAKENNLNICGYQKGYFNDDDFSRIVESIKNALPEIVIIGMGVPLQEILTAKISDSTQDKILLCVGGFIEFFFGTKKRAPDVLRNLGFEWFHRLAKEPKRLWRRYIIGIPLFVFRVLRLRFTKN